MQDSRSTALLPVRQTGAAPGGEPACVDTASGAYELTDGEALTGGTYTSTNVNENAIRAEGDIAASLNGVLVEKTGGDAPSSDASSLYGLNAASLALEDVTLDITGGAVMATEKAQTESLPITAPRSPSRIP